MFSGKLVNVSELAEQVGIDSKVVRARLDLGWDIGRALSTPVELRRT
jgi:hypothetical protein